MRAISKGGKDLGTIALLTAYPALRQLPGPEWDGALARAREACFDTMEWMRILAGAGLTTYLLRFDVDQVAAFSLPTRYLVQFVGAVSLLALLVGPFCLRRTRRGLVLEINRRHGTRPKRLGE